MTLFWIVLWVVLSAFIIAIFVWTTRVLMVQKRTWAAFAQKRGLVMNRGRLMAAPQMTGSINGLQIYVGSEERNENDFHGRRYVTAVQLGLPYQMPTAAGLATGVYRDFLKNLQASEVLAVTYPGWAPEQVLVKAEDARAAEAYFTPDRLRVLDVLIQQKNMSLLYLFEERHVTLRFESPDPMLKPGQLDKLFDKVLPLVRQLAP